MISFQTRIWLNFCVMLSQSQWGCSNKNGDTFTVNKTAATAASKIANRRQGGNPFIKKPATIRECCLPLINSLKWELKYWLQGSKDNLIQHLKDVIEQDANIAQAKKDTQLKLEQKNTLAKFLVSVYLYSLIPDNVSANVTAKKWTEQSLRIIKRIHYLHCKLKQKKGSMLSPEVYGQLEQKSDFAVSDLNTYPKLKAHVETQRGFYYAAEAVLRGARDVYKKKMLISLKS